MQVRDGMSAVVLTVGPGHTLCAGGQGDVRARAWAPPWSSTPSSPGPGILTERDILDSLAAGQDPGDEQVGDHLSTDLTFAEPDWSLERAAEAMVKGGFRHLVVVDGGELTGVLCMRDIVRCWVQDGATSEMPRDATDSRSRTACEVAVAAIVVPGSVGG